LDLIARLLGHYYNIALIVKFNILILCLGIGSKRKKRQHGNKTSGLDNNMINEILINYSFFTKNKNKKILFL
jgi:hypothetical protein